MTVSLVTKISLFQIASVVMLYAWCAATDPGDPGIFKSRGNPTSGEREQMPPNSNHEACPEEKPSGDGCSAVNNSEKSSNIFEGNNSSSQTSFAKVLCSICYPLSCLCKRHFQPDDQCSEQHATEEGMFFCTLCEAEVCDWILSMFPYYCTKIV
jgi:palmitoyltransferase ZDHHC1/11